MGFRFENKMLYGYSHSGVKESEQVALGYVAIFNSAVGYSVSVSGHSSVQPEVMQQTTYYPFGYTLEQSNYYSLWSEMNKKLYNGKDLQDDELGGVTLDWYDYGARFYNPQIGSWNSIDPLAIKFPNWSPYVYCNNNPINMVDPDGRSGEVVIDKQNRTVTVTSNLILYGSAGSAALAKSTAVDIQNQWNAAGGKVSIGGAEYSVNFVVNGSYNANLKESDVTGNADIKTITLK